MLEESRHRLARYKAEKAREVLINYIEDIPNVEAWAKKAEISLSSLNRCVTETYGKTPGGILREVRYEKIILEIKKDIQMHTQALATESGLDNPDTLRMFLRRNYSTNIRTLRRQMISGELCMKWKWLQPG